MVLELRIRVNFRRLRDSRNSLCVIGSVVHLVLRVPLVKLRKVRNDDEDAIKEASAGEVEEFKAAVAKNEQDKKDKAEGEKKEQSRLSKQNRFDGTIHLENGEREFFDGGAIGGANNYHQSKGQTKNR